ncbi:MAG TPA: riboflavin synthase [Gemmatimonas aurantiaca]|uniref:Riboflavin synthase n=2 Tax=Gemmatimonas aurantiaca TaxID=173480 RepID=C1A8F4_GEMAT|nr:riboflavin synthase [Gemmatimonas aurantiaca]BAH38514.1 riboflavin synthase alpha chain [Gemmatimonas aurantiaca T-27]HCT56159.1 riboflavin synthase [Gemmatimonas aurantiaca]
MFTGLVDDVGLIEHVADTPAGRELRIRCAYPELTDGESVAVNGACLTVREHGADDAHGSWFTVAAIETTLGRTVIGEWTAGQRVNLERAMRMGDRLGGHMVLGHVDDLGLVLRTAMAGDAWLVDVELPPALRPLTVDKGSITVNGVSLTVNEMLETGVQLSIIEFTKQHTTLGTLQAGDRVHIEADVLAKHVERLMTAYTAAHGAAHASAHSAAHISARLGAPTTES